MSSTIPEIRALDVHIPLVCDDPQLGWIVRSGEALFFLTTLKDGAPAGPRRFLGRVPPGDAFFGIALEPLSDLAVIAVGSGSTNLEPVAAPLDIVDRATQENLKGLMQAWCALLARSVDIEAPAALSRSANAPEILEFYRRFSHAWQERLSAQAIAEGERLIEEIARDRELLESEIEELSEVLDPKRHERHHKHRTADPLFEAAVLVGAALGLKITLPERTGGAVDPLRALARASHIRYRKVRLGEAWWRNDSGPLLAFSRETHEALALLPLRHGGYESVDPITNARRKIDASNAALIASAAFALYPGFPERALTLWAVIRFAIRGTGPDFARLLLFGLCAALLAAATPLATALAFGVIIPAAGRRPLFLLTTALVIAAFCSTIFALLQRFALLRFQTRAGARTQFAVWDRLLSLPTSFFRQFSAGDLSSRAMAIDSVREMITGVTLSALLGVLFSLFSFGLLFYFNVRMALAACVLVALASVLTAIGSVSQLDHSRRLLAIRGKLAGQMLQFFTAISKLRVAGAELRAFVVWSERYAEERRMGFRIETVQNRLNVFFTVWPTITTLVMFAVVMSLPSHRIPAATFLAFTAALGQFFGAAFAMLATVSTFIQVIPLFERIRPILEATPEVQAGQIDPGNLAGSIKVSHLTFRYPGALAPAIEDISFCIDPGEFVAIVGPSGAGKSSLFRLLLGFDKPETGAVYYDDRDLESLDVQAVRSQLGIVLQNADVMPGSILENIVGTSQRTLDDAWEAAAKVALEQEIAQMPMGMQTYIMEGGGAFSGGQIQRILIARALVNNPTILFLDEATSALDNTTQAQVKRSLEALKVTRVVIAHRLSTIREADRIIVVDRGRIAQTGTYDQLMAEAGPFYDLVKRQLA